MENCGWSIYIHTAPNGKVYVGATGRTPKDRWKCGWGYRKNLQFWEEIKIFGWNNIKHDILYTGLSKSDALRIEKELIVQLDATNPERGYNILIGGMKGHRLSKEIRAKQSANNARYWLGKKRSKETREAVRRANTGRKISAETRQKQSEAVRGEKNPFYGKKHSEEFKRRQSCRMKGKQRHCTVVSQFTLDGKYVATYPSIKTASAITNINYKPIVNCCAGITKQAGGYLWRHERQKKEEK